MLYKKLKNLEEKVKIFTGGQFLGIWNDYSNLR